MDAIVAELEAVGLVTIGIDADGQETWTLTEMDAQLARQMAMVAEGGQNALMAALLGEE